MANISAFLQTYYRAEYITIYTPVGGEGVERNYFYLIVGKNLFLGDEKTLKNKEINGEVI